MTRKTTNAYRALFAELRGIYQDLLQPTEVMMDFEDALRKAVMEYFPNARIFHCYFHHCQVNINNKYELRMN